MSTSTRKALVALLLLGSAPPALAMDDGAIFWRFDGLVERRFHDLTPTVEWKAKGWIGDDYNKLRLESSGVIADNGQIDGEGGTKGVDSRFYYSRLISDFWDAKLGIQATVFGHGLSRTGFVAGFEGLAPFGFHVDAVAGVNQTGIATLKLDIDYDILLSQKLIATPFVEAMVASGDDRAIDLGSGLSRFEIGARLRYEFAKEFAPFIGVSFEQFTGPTASYVAAGNEPTSKLRAIAGIKIWF
ncbi:MAG: copper resistance protein B [Alphaproteobacteria bacterium]|nr:copper resistance protein B [Alphaproteobacteria bacterium]